MFAFQHHRKIIRISLVGYPSELVVEAVCRPPYTVGEVIVPLSRQPLTTTTAPIALVAQVDVPVPQLVHNHDILT